MKKTPAPFFSVIIPTYNRWPLVGEAIESVLAQSFTSYEILVVDDGSTDESARLINDRYPKMRLITQTNRGVSAARNAGIRMAGARWLAFLDSDDLWTRNKLERQHDFILADPSVRALHTDEIWRRNGRRVNPHKKHRKTGSFENDDELFRRSVGMCLVSPSSVVIHREVFDNVGLFDEDLPVCEDYDMWLRIMTRYPIHYLDEKLTIKQNGTGGNCIAKQLSASVWGMDRYRVYALEKLAEEESLSPERKKVALEEIIKKTGIVAAGAAKRGRIEEADKWRSKSRLAVARLDETKERSPLIV